MSSMTKWLLATSMLVFGAPAAAQDLLAAPPTRSQAVPSSMGLGVAIQEWSALRQSEAMSFAAYARFLLDHPGWPAEAALRKSAERALGSGTGEPRLVADFFTRYPPTTPTAALRFAEAQAALGRSRDADASARTAWTMGGLAPDDESRLLTRFTGALTPDDHDMRMERLLWQRSTSLAARQMSLVSPARRAIYETRLALLTRAPDAPVKAAAFADRARTDPGFLADKMHYLRATGDEASARQTLAAPRRFATAPIDPLKWLEILQLNARSAASAGQPQQAYDIARQVDDAYPANTQVRDRAFNERDIYTNLTWLAGQTALRTLGRPGDAVGMFERYARAARSPQTQSKGLYWAGRAAEAAARRAEATAFYQQAAVHFDQFYGQLATERLGKPLALPGATRTLEISASERDAFNRREIVRAAEYLGTTGDWANQSLFLRTIAAAATTESDHLLGFELSRRINRPDLAVMIGRSAGINGFRDSIRAGFPTLPLQPGTYENWTMIHAIARQESQFDRKIVSRAGARGTMQLMPGTARETAGKIGISYTPSNLDDPTYNIRLGDWYFGRLMDRFNGSFPLAVAAYNAGAGNVDKWLRQNGDPRATGDILAWIEAIPFTETRGYVQRVLENAVVYDLLNPRGLQPRSAALSGYLGKRAPG
ncbi:MAG: lytic transglycosylase domain-containing protein [Sphingomonadaceae bacterium]